MAKEIVVDLWKTGAHKVEIGIKKDAEYKAKSRQFTSDSDIIGKYEQDQTNGFITIRVDPWKADKTEQRLIIKMFTESMNWKGSIEENVAEGLTKTLATGEGMPSLTVNLSNYDNLIKIDRVIKPKSLNKAMFTFMFVEGETIEPYHIEANRFTLGSDWTVFNQHDEEIAEIDGSKFNIGGKWKITIKEEYDVHAGFNEVLILFAAFVKFESDIRGRLEENADNLRKTTEGFSVKLSQEEIDLYDNPRRLKY